MNSATSFDFEHSKFNAPPSQVIPWCQIVNPRCDKGEIQPYGLAITLDNARAVVLLQSQIGSKSNMFLALEKFKTCISIKLPA